MQRHVCYRCIMGIPRPRRAAERRPPEYCWSIRRRYQKFSIKLWIFELLNYMVIGLLSDSLFPFFNFQFTGHSLPVALCNSHCCSSLTMLKNICIIQSVKNNSRGFSGGTPSRVKLRILIQNVPSLGCQDKNFFPFAIDLKSALKRFVTGLNSSIYAKNTEPAAL